jgi:hypothetical protein
MGVIWVIAIVVVFIVKGGVGTHSEHTRLRILAAGLWAIDLRIPSESHNDKPYPSKTRDKLIMRRVQVVQLWVVIFSW